MTEQPEATPPTDAEMLTDCMAGHRYVCLALRALQAPYEYDADSEIEHALRWLGQTEQALSRYIQAHAPDGAAPVRETEPNPEPEPAGSRCTSGPEPEGVVPAEPQVADPDPARDPDPHPDSPGDPYREGEAARNGEASQPT